MAQQWNRSTERKRRGMSQSAAAEVVVVTTPRLGWFQRIRGRGMGLSHRLNLCYSWIHHAEHVQRVRARCE